MKVLFVSNSYSPAVQLQVEGLRSLGIDVSMLLSDRASLGRLAYVWLCRHLKKRLREIQPDIVHVQFGGVQAAIVASAIPNRCVITFHGTDLHGGTRTPSFVSALSQRFGVWCSSYASRRVVQNILVSETLREYLPKSVSHACVIPTGVDFNCFKPIDRNECLTALKLDPEVRWVLFCDYSHDPVKRRDLADNVLAKVQAAGHRGRFLELSGVEHEMVPIYLNAAHALLVTSDKEGSPNIVKEALACNIPVVSVDVGDVSTRISGIDGCHLCSRESGEIAAALCRVLESPGRVYARDQVSSEIDNITVCKRIVSVYESIGQ